MRCGPRSTSSTVMVNRPTPVTTHLRAWRRRSPTRLPSSHAVSPATARSGPPRRRLRGGSSAAGGRFVLFDHAAGDPTPLADVDTLALGPVADSLVLRPIRPHRCPTGASAGRCRDATTADAAG